MYVILMLIASCVLYGCADDGGRGDGGHADVGIVDGGSDGDSPVETHDGGIRCDSINDCPEDPDPADCNFVSCAAEWCTWRSSLYGDACGTPDMPGTCRSGRCVPIGDQ